MCSADARRPGVFFHVVKRPGGVRLRRGHLGPPLDAIRLGLARFRPLRWTRCLAVSTSSTRRHHRACRLRDTTPPPSPGCSKCLDHFPHQSGRWFTSPRRGDRRDADIVRPGRAATERHSIACHLRDTYLRGRREGKSRSCFKPECPNAARARVHSSRAQLAIESPSPRVNQRITCDSAERIDDGVALLAEVRYLAGGPNSSLRGVPRLKPGPMPQGQRAASPTGDRREAVLCKAAAPPWTVSSAASWFRRGLGSPAAACDAHSQVDRALHLTAAAPMKFFSPFVRVRIAGRAAPRRAHR